MIKGIVIGFLLAAVLIVGGVYYYFSSGMAPAASADPAMPFETKLAHLALDLGFGQGATGHASHAYRSRGPRANGHGAVSEPVEIRVIADRFRNTGPVCKH